MGESVILYIKTLPLEIFTKRNFVADFIWLTKFYWKINKKSLFEPFWKLRGNVRTPYIARWKARGRLPIRHNWTFSLSITVQTLQAEICWSRRFLKGWGTLSPNFRRKGASPSNHCWCQKTRVIALSSCGIKIPGSRCNPRPVATGRVDCVCDWLRDATGLDFGDRFWICNAAPQCIVWFCHKARVTRVTDGQTDGQTDGRTGRITTPKTALAYLRGAVTKNPL